MASFVTVSVPGRSLRQAVQSAKPSSVASFVAFRAEGSTKLASFVRFPLGSTRLATISHHPEFCRTNDEIARIFSVLSKAAIAKTREIRKTRNHCVDEAKRAIVAGVRNVSLGRHPTENFAWMLAKFSEFPPAPRPTRSSGPPAQAVGTVGSGSCERQGINRSRGSSLRPLRGRSHHSFLRSRCRRSRRSSFQ